MESKITISFDYEQNTPFIKIQYTHSEDERDKMVGKFLEKFGGEVCFAKFQYEVTSHANATVSAIRPIPYIDLKEEIKVMKAWIDHVEREIIPRSEAVSGTS